MILSDVDQLISDAGWYEGRLFDISEYEQLLKKCGYILNSTALKFLSEYGGLRVEYTRKTDIIEEERFGFDVKIAIKNFNTSYLPDYEKACEKELCAIGTSECDNMILLMSQSGSFFAAMDDTFLLLGRDHKEGIQNLYEGKVLQRYELDLD